MNKELVEKILQFHDERNWKQFYNPKDLAISILGGGWAVGEFSSDTAVLENKENIAEELADIMIYCLYMADVLGLDMEQTITYKLAKNAEKYEVDKAYGNEDKYNHC